MTARLLVGDVHERLQELVDGSVDLILTSPPFLALRSYLPDGHPDKAKEIGSEPTPAAYIDVLLQLTAEWGRVLAPHGSIAVELGDTYAGSGGAGGDYGENGLREGQPTWTSPSARIAVSHSADMDSVVATTAPNGSPTSSRPRTADESRRGVDARNRGNTSRGTLARQRANPDAWPLPKSLACIPQLYQVALAYGINPLTGQPSPAGRWRVRTLKPWIRSNPPVGALGDKERPATSYVVVACRASDRWFDLDAVRTEPSRPRLGTTKHKVRDDVTPGTKRGSDLGETEFNNAGGAPPRDWWHHVDAVIDAELALRAGKPVSNRMTAQGIDRQRVRGKTGAAERGGNWGSIDRVDPDEPVTGAQGVHLRRALERAGILTTLEALDVSPRGYSGAHYAVWPPELCRLLIDEMCPRRVCTTCGQPSRRIVESSTVYLDGTPKERAEPLRETTVGLGHRNSVARHAETLGWSDCEHGTWRPGHILDPFAGSGTTLAVATGMGRTATGIDIDPRNADLARERVGMFLEIDHPTPQATA